MIRIKLRRGFDSLFIDVTKLLVTCVLLMMGHNLLTIMTPGNEVISAVVLACILIFFGMRLLKQNVSLRRKKRKNWYRSSYYGRHSQ